MYRDPEDCSSDAQRFCMQERDWLVETARRASQRRGLNNLAEDIAQEISKKAEYIADEVWAGKKNKKAYVARMVINRAEDLRRQNHDFEALTDTTLPSSPLEAMNAALLLQELYDKLPTEEQTLLVLVFQQYPGIEIAARLGVKPATARKRISRLMEKLASMTKGKQASFEVQSLGRKQLNTAQ